MIKKVNHIGIAVSNGREALKFFEDTFGLKATGTETVEDQKVKVFFIPVGETRIELLEPTAPDSPVQKFIEKRGGGMHHIAFEVEDIESELEKLSRQGVQLIDTQPRKGAHGTRIAFIHPRSTGGILLELCQTEG
ncbi:MAG: methylmalonyl-CoA epimerase [Candidatus Bathyarchaeia archaeon]